MAAALRFERTLLLSEKTSAPNPSKPGKKRHLFSLRIKFIFFLSFLFIVVIGSVGWLVSSQMQQTLTQQVINRAEAQARSLSSSSAEILLNALTQNGDVLALMDFMKDAVQQETGQGSQNIPSGLDPWQEQVLAFSGTYNEMVQKYIWPDAADVKRGDTEYAFIIDKNNKYQAY